jgi:threonine dehydrogenase-like Zn-dependent dehydrogenase
MRSMEHAIALIESQRWPFERFASHSFTLEQAEQGVRSLMGDHKPIHVRIVPSVDSS